MIQYFGIGQRLNSVYGIQICFLKNGSFRCSGVLLKLEDDTLHIEETFTSNDLNELFSKLDFKTPLVISIDGVGVLHKSTQSIDFDFEDVFPQASKDDFFVQQTLINSVNWFSILRQDKINFLFETIKNYKFQIHELYLGAFSIQGIVNLLSSVEAITTLGAQVSPTSMEVAPLNNFNDFASTDIYIQNEVISSECLVSYSLAFSYFQEIEGVVAGTNPVLSAYQSKRIDELVSSKIAKILLTTIGVLAVVNVVLYFTFLPKYEALKEDFLLNQTINNRYNSYVDQIKEYEALLSTSGLSYKVFPHSYIADQIASTLPSEVIIKQLNLYPIDEHAKQKERVLRFKDHKIIIKGESPNASLVNQWIEKINQCEWVDSVVGSKFKFDSFKAVGVFEFTINCK